MKQDKTEDFNRLIARAMEDPAVSHMRPVIAKELIHYDLLYALDREGLLDSLVFQGGTSLRLCYGGKRFSEDLDFAGGKDFSSSQLREIRTCIEDYLSSRYRLEVRVKEPASLKQERDYADLRVDKWQVAIVTDPGRRDMPRQRIKLEVANVPAHTRIPMPLRRNYDFLPDGYEDMLLFVETRNEIMADKLVSLPATEKYVRYRDIWDLAFLSQERAVADPALVELKVADYRLTDDYPDKLDTMIQHLPDIIHSKKFMDEMRRFLPSDTFDRTLGRTEKFLPYLEATVAGLLREVKEGLYQSASEPPFRM